MSLKRIIFPLLFFNLSLAFAKQDGEANDTVALEPHLWNDFIITEIQNPALTGTLHKHKVYFDFDRPWYFGYDKSYSHNNYRLGYSLVVKEFSEKLSLGIGAFYALETSTFSRRHSTGINTSFGIQFKNESKLYIGATLLAIQIKTPEFEELSFGSQFDGEGFNINLASGEYYSDDKITNYGPLNLGIWYNANRFFVGTSWVNLTVPKESFYGSDEGTHSPLLSYYNAGYHFVINDKVIITPSLQYRNEIVFSSQGGVIFHAADPRLTFSFCKNRIIAGSYYQDDQIFALLGANLFRHWVVNLDLGYQINDKESAVQSGTVFRAKTRLYF